VKDHPGGVDDAAQGWPFERGESLDDAVFDGDFIHAAAEDEGAALLDGAADLGDDEYAWEPREGREETLGQFVDRGKAAEAFGLSHH
jgi:hypothetical protein